MLQVLICVLCCTWTRILAEKQPPGIYLQPNYDVFYKSGETVQLDCVADAIPNATYTWTRNGFAFNPSGNDDRMVQLANVGTIVINRPEDRDEGIYQCFAENIYGKSATINIKLREAKLKEFDVEYDRHYFPQLGGSLTLNCVPPEGVPQPEVFWVVKEKYGDFTPVNFSARVSMDHEYRLRFANVQTEDSQDHKAYVCFAINKVLRKSVQGPADYVQPMGGIQEQRPVTYLWASPTDHFGLRGEEFKIKCIFAGFPTPIVHWVRVDGKTLPAHVQPSSFGQELVFNKLELTDAGDYECRGQNDVSSHPVQRTISVRVESRPIWTEEPSDVELGTGGTAHFKCLADGVPKPFVYWHINSVPLHEVKDPRIDHRFQVVNTNEVVFTNVGISDSMVIQCNVTNKHGHIWGDVYLNVICKSRLVAFKHTALAMITRNEN